MLLRCPTVFCEMANYLVISSLDEGFAREIPSLPICIFYVRKVYQLLLGTMKAYHTFYLHMIVIFSSGH